MPWETITIAEICSFIAMLAGIIAVIRAWVAPALKLVKRVEALENQNSKLMEKSDKTWQASMMLCKAMDAVIDNIVTNETGKLKDVRSTMIEFLSK